MLSASQVRQSRMCREDAVRFALRTRAQLEYPRLWRQRPPGQFPWRSWRPPLIWLQAYESPQSRLSLSCNASSKTDRRAGAKRNRQPPLAFRKVAPADLVFARDRAQPASAGRNHVAQGMERSPLHHRVASLGGMVGGTNSGSGHYGSRLECSDECSAGGTGARAPVFSAARRRQGQRRLPTTN
jgi:hypothetical protein